MDICVGGSKSCTCQEKLKSLTCWWAECGETVSLKNHYKQIWYILHLYMLFFRFDASPKKLLLHGCYGISGKYCKQYQYFWVFLDIQIKYSWKSIISLLKYCTLHKTHLALQYWQPYFFHDFSYQEHDFVRFVGS